MVQPGPQSSAAYIHCDGQEHAVKALHLKLGLTLAAAKLGGGMRRSKATVLLIGWSKGMCLFPGASDRPATAPRTTFKV
jgi:hypothetical protein